MPTQDDIAKSILDARDEVVARLLRTPDAREAVRYDAAYAALMGHEAPPWTERMATPPSRSESMQSVRSQPAANPTKTGSGDIDGGKHSVRARVVAILEEAPGTTWTNQELLTEMVRRGWASTANGGDIRASMRTAVWGLGKKGSIIKDSVSGRFWAATHDDEIADAAKAAADIVPLCSSNGSQSNNGLSDNQVHA